MYPQTRMRRMRQSDSLRSLVRETRVHRDDLIYPIFVRAGTRDVEPIHSMPGQVRWTVGDLAQVARRVKEHGIRGILLFGLPKTKDEIGSEAYRADGVVQQSIKTIKDATPDLTVIADTCLDEYTTHGHCGIVVDGGVDNDATLEVLTRIAVSQAEAGADMVAPSDMMDGRVGCIRGALDANGLGSTGIMAYAVKYSSAFYGPFREAAECAPKFGDRRSYQMDPANAREAQREAELDIAEGADIIMVKPAVPYLDIVRQLRTTVSVPLAAYHVSGEYAMLKAAAIQGWIEERSAVLETLTCIKRAGADIILTYHALDAANWLREAD